MASRFPAASSDVGARLDQLEHELSLLRSRLLSSPGTSSGDGATWTADGVSYSAVEFLPLEQKDEKQSDTAAAKPKADPPKYPTITVTGFFQTDAAFFGQDSDSRAALVQGQPIDDIQDGADFRRTRLAAKGDVWGNVGYMIEMDFAFPGRPSFMDVFMEVRQIPLLGDVRFGQWRQPFSLDGMTSVRELTFLERALPFAFIPFRQIGTGFRQHTPEQRATWAMSLIRYPTDFFGSNVGDDGGYGLVTRATWLPMDWGDDGVMHLGFGYSVIDPANNIVRFRNQPEIFVSETPGSLAPIGVPTNVPVFVDTGDVPTDVFHLFGAEWAATHGSVHAQSEVIWAVVDRTHLDTVTFSGAYFQAGWILTGEHRAYDKVNAALGRIVPQHPFWPGCGLGAWELAIRWSYLDLNNNDVQGNRLDNVTFGLNWYLNKNAKLQLNYIRANLDAVNVNNADSDIIGMRAQVDF